MAQLSFFETAILLNETHTTLQSLQSREEAKLAISFPVSSCAFHHFTLLNEVRVGLFVCLFGCFGSWLQHARASVATRTFHCSCIEFLAVASGLLLPVGSCSLTRGSDPCPCIVRWIPHQSSFNTELDDAISCLDNVWLNTMDRLICSHPTVAHQASFYLFLATAYPVIAAFLSHTLCSIYRPPFFFNSKTQ